MSGTSVGSKKASVKILAKNPNHYKEIGRRGGLVSTTGGFAANHTLASIAGRKGGLTSRRGPAKPIKQEIV